MSTYFGGRVSYNTDRHARQNVAFLVAGVGAFLISAVCAFTILRDKPLAEPQLTISAAPEAQIEALIPDRVIEPGTALDEKLFSVQLLPVSLVAPGSVRSLEEIKGRVAKHLIPAKHPLHRDYLATLESRAALAAKLPEGYRAVAVKVDQISTVEGWLQPADRVDVLMISTRAGNCKLVPIVQNALVLSVNGSLEASASAKANPTRSGTVTLSLISEDANRVHLASAIGSITFNLRGESMKSSDMAVISCRDVDDPQRDRTSGTCRNKLSVGGKTICLDEEGRIQSEIS